MITIFTDGAAKGNPGPGGWGAIVATEERVRELGDGAPHTTNNKMELTGVIEALRAARGVEGKIELHTDSTYVIRGITEWIHGWRRRGWRTAEGQPVLNRELWEALALEVAGRGRGGIHWHYVRGHSAIPGNERCDEIATGFAAGERPDLYDGPRAGYPVAIHERPADTSVPKRSSGSGNSKSAPAYAYLSLVGGVAMRHPTWAECERRVRGVSGARFKKATSADDEAAILRAWGASLK
ncbi:ribonuclease HI [bacterium]|nr:ribonuclease HI [bacterium]